MKEKLKDNQALIMLLSNVALILVFLYQDFYGFRTSNFEKMTEKFALKETVTLISTNMDSRLKRIEDKLDAAIASKK